MRTRYQGFANVFLVSFCLYLLAQKGLFCELEFKGAKGLVVQFDGFHVESNSSTIIISPATTKCGTELIEYQPSILEKSWKIQIASLKSNDAAWERGCSKIRREFEAHKKLVHDIERHALAERPASSSNLSYHVYEDKCTGLTKKVPIEPLTSFLRHPLAICSPGAAPELILDKSFLLIPFAHEVGANQSYKWLRARVHMIPAREGPHRVGL